MGPKCHIYFPIFLFSYIRPKLYQFFIFFFFTLSIKFNYTFWSTIPVAVMRPNTTITGLTFLINTINFWIFQMIPNLTRIFGVEVVNQQLQTLNYMMKPHAVSSQNKEFAVAITRNCITCILLIAFCSCILQYFQIYCYYTGFRVAVAIAICNMCLDISFSIS